MDISEIIKTLQVKNQQAIIEKKLACAYNIRVIRNVLNW